MHFGRPDGPVHKGGAAECRTCGAHRKDTTADYETDPENTTVGLPCAYQTDSATFPRPAFGITNAYTPVALPPGLMFSRNGRSEDIFAGTAGESWP